MEDILSFAFSGIYSILLLTLTFNFLLSIRTRILNKKIEEANRKSREEAELLEKRLIVVKELIKQKKGGEDFISMGTESFSQDIQRHGIRKDTPKP